MPDKKIEEYFVHLFLKHYNSCTGKRYAVISRPEEDKSIAGTYDFLCKDMDSADDYLAVEETTLNESTESVRDNEVVLRLIDRVTREINEKGLLSDREYSFYVDLKSAPKKNELDRYVQKIAEIVEQAINNTKYKDINDPISFDPVDLDCIKSLKLKNVRRSKTGRALFSFHTEKNIRLDLYDVVSNPLFEMLVTKDSKLKIPKSEGKKTILLIINCLHRGNEHMVQDAMQCFDSESHDYIDEVFLVTRKHGPNNYDVQKIN